MSGLTSSRHATMNSSFFQDRRIFNYVLLGHYRKCAFGAIIKFNGFSPNFARPLKILMNQARLVTPESDAEAQKKIKYDLVNLNHEALCKAFDMCDEVIHEIGKEKKVKVINVTPLLNGRTEFFIDQTHLNNEGSEIISDLTATALNKILNERQNKISATESND